MRERIFINISSKCIQLFMLVSWWWCNIPHLDSWALNPCWGAEMIILELHHSVSLEPQLQHLFASLGCVNITTFSLKVHWVFCLAAATGNSHQAHWVTHPLTPFMRDVHSSLSFIWLVLSNQSEAYVGRNIASDTLQCYPWGIPPGESSYRPPSYSDDFLIASTDYSHGCVALSCSTQGRPW